MVKIVHLKVKFMAVHECKHNKVDMVLMAWAHFEPV